MTWLAHHPYDTFLAFVIALVGIALIMWAERRAKARRRDEEGATSDREPTADRPPSPSD